MKWVGTSLVLSLLASSRGVVGAEGPSPPWRRVVLVELFTSQGCSSCPAADEFAKDLPALGFGRDKVALVSCHVDYWDNLGWRDPFSQSRCTRRQEWYVQRGMLRSPNGMAGIGGPYTPQMIVDGRVHFSGQRRQDGLTEIQKASAHPVLFALTAQGSLDGPALELTVNVTDSPARVLDRDWRLTVVLAVSRTRTGVTRGENAGETLEGTAVAREISDRIPLAPAPRTPIHLRLAKPADVPWSNIEVVAFVQSETSHEIGAAMAIEGDRLLRPRLQW